ncbi:MULTISPECIES: DUF998 domain-containing protein [Ktedonobacter]|uniref:DUF998 domain-containing protein n=1 Tax=Ktedonobacter robiniae TaxID=2778365 RepID=A0ABQ3V056_9CHLR|nr:MULTISPECIES: DUF998 domain-containing protein [Ktedonobacter]GHO58526.1 hypothetical protein KSB_70010 [Ktedonobacter robiniae]GHO61195.1 hypothetical protein KSC_000870 [Ktedonobacter sp. SOSP1-52]
MKTLAQSTGEQSTATGLLLVCGALGSLCNMLVLLILGATRSGYNAWQIPDSSLELGPGGWIQITNYIVSGVLLLAFAIGLRRVLRTGRGSTWGPILLGLFGLSFIGIGIFVTDPVLGYPSGASSITTIPGTIHNLFGQLQFISLAAACFVLARREAADPASRGWAWYSVATGLLVVASDVVFVLTFKLLDGGPVGLIARIGIIVSGCWIAQLSIRLMRKRPR